MRYDYCCDKCGKIFEFELSMVDRNSLNGKKCKECDGVLQRSYESSSVCRVGDPYHVSGKKIDSGFKEVLQRIQRRHPKGNINV